MRRSSLLLFFLFILICPLSLAAHPHMSFTTKMEFAYQNDEMAGVWQEWRFDVFFSGTIRQGYDWDGDNEFNEEETDAVFAGAFANLENYDYFMFYRTGGETFTPSETNQFSVWMEEDVMVYRFFVPLDVKNREIWLSVFDVTYFCAIFYEEDAAKTTGRTAGTSPIYLAEKNEDNPIYYNPTSPANDNTRYTKWAPGLETAYPEEIHVRY